MKKLHTFSYLAAATAAVVAPFMSCVPVSAAATTSYQDFSALSSALSHTYAYTKVYWADDTKISVVKAAGNATLGQSITLENLAHTNFSYITEGQSLTLLIEDSTAKDANGQKVDVLYKVSDVHQWLSDTDDNGNPKAYSILTIDSSIYGSSAATQADAITNHTEPVTLKAGDPIIAWNQTRHSDSVFTVQFCKKGTYNASTDTCTPAGLTNLTSAHWDFDVPNGNQDENGNYTLYGDKDFNGNESIQPQSGNVTFYYDKNNRDTDTELIVSDGGFAVKKTGSSTFDGIFFGNSVFTTVTNMPNSSWSYRYGGTGCGSAFMIGSAVPYQMPKPTKAVDKATARPGEAVTYRIKQEVPDNYTGAGDTATFMSLYSNYPNISSDKRYLSFTISDSFDGNLALPNANQIVVRNELGTVVTDQFNAEINGQNLKLTAKDTSTDALYGHTYTVVVPTTVKGEVNLSPIQNRANTTYRPTGGDETTLTSDPVETVIMHKVTTRYIDDETEEEIADSDVDEYRHGATYETVESDDIPEKYVLVKTVGETTGTVNSDIEVVYRYTPPRIVKTVYIDDETGEELADPTEEEYAKGSEYETTGLEEIPKDYALVETPKNAKGTVNENITVIYRYRKVKNPKTFDDGLFVSISMSLASVAGFGIFVLRKRRG